MNAESSNREEISDRIQELGGKATQLLTFLSFALVAAVLLETSNPPVLGACQKIAMKWTMRFWVLAFFPILVNVLPLKEFNWRDPKGNWFGFLRWAKFVLLWVAVFLIACGVIAFLVTIW